MTNKLTDEQIMEKLKGLKVGDSLVGLIDCDARSLTKNRIYCVIPFSGLKRWRSIKYDDYSVVVVGTGGGDRVFRDIKNGLLGFVEEIEEQEVFDEPDEPKETQVFELNNTKWRNNHKRVCVYVVTDQAGLNKLHEIQADVLKREQIAVYEIDIENHQGCIKVLNEKIQKLKGENK